MDDSDSDSGSDYGTDPGPSSKRMKGLGKAGAAVYRTKFNLTWTKAYPFIVGVKDDPYKFLCTICQRQVACEHQGKHDVERHIGKTMHQANTKTMKAQSTLNFRSGSSSALAEKVMRAEVKIAHMLVQNNIPFTLADELTPMFQDIFSDSEIARNFSSRRMKTTCIINGAVAPSYQQSLVETMKTAPYSVAIDGSTDQGVEKMNPLTVRVFNTQSGMVHTQFLDMCLSSQSTAAGIFQKMQDALEKHDLSWINCVGIAVDNTSVNVGRRNSIKTRLQTVNPAIYTMGCPCHIVHNICVKANSAFEAVSGFDVDDIVIDLFFWFEKSTKRKANLVEYCNFCDINYRDIVKHSSTRWLSLERAVHRVLQQYDGLKSYFLSEDESTDRFARLHSAFSKPMTEVCLLFYQAVLQTFIHFNQFLQREDPLIPVVSAQIVCFLRKLASKFVRVDNIKAAGEDFTKLQYNLKHHQLPDNSIFIGITTRTTLRKLLEEGDIGPSDESKLYASVRAFFVRAMQYALDNLPIGDLLLRNAGFLNFESRDSATFSQVEFFVERYDTLLPFQSAQEQDSLLEEFIDFQLMQESDIPQCVWDESTVVVNEASGTKHYRLDSIWHHLKAPDHSYRFHRLSQVAKLVLVIPHSNAQEERVFSMIRKNKTAFRPNLDPKGTLSSIITVKLGSTEKPHQYEPSKEVLKRAKSATWEYNKAHSKKK